ncbi:MULTISPECIES: hypothetical protein [unclassified Pseudomonas]|uniref:hypothetical protein n=1 Tax=unclassified Pseudomonas TaxID=196821 RepID=UPI001661075F|nr:MULTISPECIES: hypothetical protein [unclassified Pseudomonas]MBD0702684.1 hypothetical protein [Pseudomonas sp. PSB1]MDR8385047.1 hypothetical protein [Pseudomonas sp. JL2]WNZ79943.1 hypothetical protein QOM08_07625 [Pseudomonas sp. P105]
MKRPDIDVYASMGERAASPPSGSKLPRHKFFLRGSANKRQDYVTVVGHFPVEKPDNIEEQLEP